MKIAFIILAHRQMAQVARLIRVLNIDQDVFFVHIDKRADRIAGRSLWAELKGQLGADADVRAVRRHRCYWGSLGLVLATLEGIKAVLDSGDRYDRVILLSGQDYPIKSVPYIRTFLERRPHLEFVESFSFAKPNRWSDFGGPYSDVSRAWFWHLRVRGHWLHSQIRRRFPLDLIPHGGSQWWCLSWDCVNYIHRFVAEHPGFLRYYRHAFIPDEQFFQTILSNSPFARRIAGADLTFVDSSRPEPPWPATMDTSYLPTLLESPKLFARKFDQAHDAHILDLLDHRLGLASH